MPLTLTSSAFSHQGSIPEKYTCEGIDISPPLVWKNVPTGTQSLTLIVDDPDAPDPKAPKMTWVHWLLFNIPVDCHGLEESAKSGNLPASAVEGLNDWNKLGYGGPCPPIGEDRYFFKLYALDTLLSAINNATKADIESAMEGHIIESAELMGRFQK